MTKTKLRERVRGTRRCPRCGFNRTGTSGGNRYCPECSWTDKPEPVPEHEKNGKNLPVH
jgi:hypothetical protein